jgi:AMP nucleosidase
MLRSSAGKMAVMHVRRQEAQRVSQAFEVVQTPNRPSTVWRPPRASHRRLSQALKRYLKDRTEPGPDERALFRYPALRLTYFSQGEVAATTRAYAKVQVPAPTASPSPSPPRSVATCWSNCGH